MEQDDVKGASEWLEIMSAINDLELRNQPKLYIERLVNKQLKGKC
jgi:hypothetical protein